MDLDRIYCGDAYKLIREIPDKSVDLIVTDPPYDIVGLHNTTKFKRSYLTQLSDLKLGGGIKVDILDEYLRIMKLCNIYIWCNKEQVLDYLSFFVGKHKFCFDILVWAKTNPLPFCGKHYLKDKEYCLYFRSSKAYFHTSYSSARSFYVSSTNTSDKDIYGCPCCKPESIISNLVSNSSREGDVVFDSFVGSGTTCAVAKKLGRHYLGFEIDCRTFNIAVDRCNGITPYERKISDDGQMSLF